MISISALPFLGKTFGAVGRCFSCRPSWGFVWNLFLFGRGCIAFHPCLLSAVTPFLRICNSQALRREFVILIHNSSALSPIRHFFLGEGRCLLWFCGCRGTTALQPNRCRAVALTRFASSNLSICGSGKMDGRLCPISNKNQLFCRFVSCTPQILYFCTGKA